MDRIEITPEALPEIKQALEILKRHNIVRFADYQSDGYLRVKFVGDQPNITLLYRHPHKRSFHFKDGGQP